MNAVIQIPKRVKSLAILAVVHILLVAVILTSNTQWAITFIPLVIIIIITDAISYVYTQLFGMTTISITNNWISVNNVKFARCNISAIDIERLSSNGQQGQYIVIKFVSMPPLPFAWKFSNYMRTDYPMRRGNKSIYSTGPIMFISLHDAKMTEQEASHILNLGSSAK